MDQQYHVFSHGELKRYENTLRFTNEEGDYQYLPIETVDAIFMYGEVTFNSKVLGLLEDHGVEIHVFGWYDDYVGSFVPRKSHISGETLVNQVHAYSDTDHRLLIAKSMVGASIHNMRRNVQYYDGRDRDLTTQLTGLDDATQLLDTCSTIPEVMGAEAQARKSYYATFDSILTQFEFEKRTFRPPRNEVNALISFGNALVYSSCLSAIHATALDPTISFLHEPGTRRYSLSLDIADIFKPVLVDRTLFQVVNRGQLSADDFRHDVNSCLLTEDGRKVVVTAYEETLERTIEHPKLKRSVSYKHLLKLEAYALKKHILTDEPYEAFRRWW